MAIVVYPYDRFDDQLELRVGSLKVDLKDAGDDLISPALELVSLYQLESADWATAALSITAIVPQGVVPKFDDEEGDAQVTAIAYCTSTNARQAVSLKQSGDRERWTGTLELDRDAYAGKVELYAVATAGVDKDRRLVGETTRWRLYFDEPAIPPVEGMLPVKWLDFSDAEQVPDPAREEPFFVALSETPPAVYLNKTFPKLPDLLTEEDQGPASERALRDAEYRRIATAAWSEMFAAAMASVSVDDENQETEWPEADWQRTALEALLPRIYPGNREDALAKAHEALHGDDQRDLQARLQVAVSKQIGASESLKKNLSQIV